MTNKFAQDWDAAGATPQANSAIATQENALENYFCLSGINSVSVALKELQQIFGNKLHEQIFLELGCGIGRETRYFSDVFNKVIAVDASKSMIEKGQVRVKNNNIQWLQCDGDSLPIADQSVDILYSFIVLQHCTTQTVLNYFAEVQRVLKLGGIFIFQLHVGPVHKEISNYLQFSTWTKKEVLAGLQNMQEIKLTECGDSMAYHIFKKIKNIEERLDDLTIIIPHHDQTERLASLMVDLKMAKNVFISKGGSFAENCNRGFLNAKTEYVCFLNDDTRVADLKLFRNMINLLKSDEKIGLAGCNTDKKCNGFNIVNKRIEYAREAGKPAYYPSGCCMVMRAKDFRDVGMLDEIYKNGAEDVDLFFKLEDKGFKMGIVPDVIIHNEASSGGRFDHLDENIKIFNARWGNKCKIG